MKLPLIAASLCLFGSSLAFADITITQQVRNEGPQPTDMTMTLKYKEGKMRVDMTKPVNMSSIVDAKSGDTITMLHDQKMVTEIPGTLVKSLKDKAKAQMPASTEKQDFKPTGKTETINGFACEEYSSTTPTLGTINIWTTKDIPEGENILKEMSSISGDTDPVKDVLKDSDVPGFPIKTILDSPQFGKVTVTVVGLSQTPLPVEEFAVPADYQKIQMPKLPGQ